MLNTISDGINALSDKQKDAYWWYYGEIGQKLVEQSEHIKTLLKKGYKITDGHEPIIGRFSNLNRIQHLDIVIYDSKKNLIKGICEVKTTKNQSKKEFPSNGVCAPVMKQAERNRIPLFFAVVRLTNLLPTKIISEKGFKEVLAELLKDDSSYKIEFYKGKDFALEDGIFKIKT